MMSSFSYVYVGNVANDGTGTALRDAFAIIDANFANIASGNATINVNAPVQTVANRTGNISLTVNDVGGAASIGYVNSLSLAGNAYVTATLSNVQALINTLSNVDVSVVETTVLALQMNVGVLLTQLGTLNANLGVQYTELTPLPSAVSSLQSTTSNLTSAVNSAATTITTHTSAIAGLVSGNTYTQTEIVNLTAGLTAANLVFSTANTAWQNNVGAIVANLAASSQNAVNLANLIYSADANVTAVNVAISGINTSLSSLNANVAAANAAIVTANTAVVSHFTSVITPIQANTGNLAAILGNSANNSANISILFTDVASINSNVTAANAAIVTANSAMKSYVDNHASNFTNANISAYLPSYSGNIGNVTTNTLTTTTGVFWPNGAPYAPLPIIIASVPPTINSDGELWWDSNAGSAYVSYQSDWIDLIPGGYTPGGSGTALTWQLVESLNITGITSSSTSIMSSMSNTFNSYLSSYHEFFIKISTPSFNSPTFPSPSKLLPLITVNSNEWFGLGTAPTTNGTTRQFSVNFPNFANTAILVTALDTLNSEFGATTANVYIYAR
jgi:hypothetical protein